MRGLLLVILLSLSACATTARLHDRAELDAVGERCGLALGELFQDESEKRLLFLVSSEVTPGQRTCVFQWAKRNRLNLVQVENIEFSEN